MSSSASVPGSEIPTLHVALAHRTVDAMGEQLVDFDVTAM